MMFYLLGALIAYSLTGIFFSNKQKSKYFDFVIIGASASQKF